MKSVNKWVVVISCLVVSLFQVAYADESNDFYAGVGFHYMNNKVGNATDGEAQFKPMMLGFNIGAYLQPQLAVELFGMLPLTDDRDLRIDMKANSAAGILGRFETPEAEGGKLFFLLGYGMNELEMTRSAFSNPDKELYHGFIYGGGMEFRVPKSNHLIGMQAMRHYHENDITLDSLSLTYRYQF